jgi:N-carbamoylputrescine amidase
MTSLADADTNLKKAIERIRDAKKQGAQIVCLQELFRSPYFCQTNDDRFFDLAEPIPGPGTDELVQVAKELDVVIVASLFEKSPDGYYNTACVLDPDGGFLGKYRKLHIPDDLANHYSELYYFKPGDLGAPVFKTKYGTIGVLVCWDQWYPEPARELASKGAEIIFYPTAIGWPRAERSKDIGKNEFDAWVTMQRSHAIANGVFVAACNRTGKEDNLQFWGGTFVSDPFGVVVKQASHDNEEIITTTIDLSRVSEVRRDWPFLTCRRMVPQFK